MALNSRAIRRPWVPLLLGGLGFLLSNYSCLYLMTCVTLLQVANYLPSISAAIGGHMPEKFIWRVGIALHCLPRVLVMPYYLQKYFKNTTTGRKYNLETWWFKLLNLSASLLHLVENGALITLTYISSTDNYGKPCSVLNSVYFS